MLYEGSECHAFGRTRAEATERLQQRIDALYGQILARWPETRARHLARVRTRPARPKHPIIDAIVDEDGEKVRVYVRYVENPADHAVPKPTGGGAVCLAQ